MMITVSCRSNIDGVMKEKWPNELQCLPNIGDLIESESGLQLEVCRCVFLPIRSGENCGVIEIDLILPRYRFATISAFQTWYRKRTVGER
jgi:hypothetical protein